MLVFLLIALSGCSRVKTYSGIAKRAPDEFLVYNRIPPKIPNEFKLIPPPHNTKEKNTAVFKDVLIQKEKFSIGEQQLLELLEKTTNPS